MIGFVGHSLFLRRGFLQAAACRLSAAEVANEAIHNTTLPIFFRKDQGSVVA